MNPQIHALLEKRAQVLLDLGFRKEALPQLTTYTDLLWTSNSELNLFSRKMQPEELLDNHLIDCFLTLKYFPSDVTGDVADLGSGGGLPGVLYALQYPHINFHLYEKSPKKQIFLRRCKAIAPNLIIAGEIKPGSFKGIGLVTARAFKPVDVILQMSREHYLNGGKYFLLKGRREKINEELLATKKKFEGLHAEVITLTSPVLTVERHLVII